MKPFNEYMTRETRLSQLRDKQWQLERDHRRTREERRMRRITLIIETILVIAFLIIAVLLAFPRKAKAETASPIKVVTPSMQETLEDHLLEEQVNAADVNAEAQEPISYEEQFKADSAVLENCKLTHYCCEKRAHICGTGDGITSTGAPVTAGYTCAVDPSVIPYGADILIEYEDGSTEFRKAQDCGGSVKGNHLDLAVETHEEALNLGVTRAVVYWRAEE